MDLKFYGFCFADFLLIATSFIYGVKFLKKSNYLLGIELLIVAVSASNFLFYALSNVHFAYNISYFLDAFSRGFGIPVIAVAGLMAVTHRYRPSILVDVAFFGLAVAGAVVLVASDVVIPLKPYFYVVMWAIFSIYLAYFAKRLLNVGENLHAFGLLLALISSQAIACIYDFYKIPGDDDHMLFYILAVTAWSYLNAEMYYAYCAMERTGTTELKLKQGHALDGLERHF